MTSLPLRIALCLLLAATSVRAGEIQDAAARLQKTEWYAFGGGIFNTLTAGETNYLLLLPRPDAEALFLEVYRDGNLQAKCYALTGLKKLGSPRFAVLAKELSEQNPPVTTLSGCIVGKKSARDIVVSLRTDKAQP